jgi:hypothetical protein
MHDTNKMKHSILILIEIEHRFKIGLFISTKSNPFFVAG